jgi:exopolysaccharide production protein ExoQ
MSTATLRFAQPLHEKIALTRAPAWLSCLLLSAILIVPSYDFRPEADETFGLDVQLMIRLAICGACGLYGLTFWRSASSYLLNFPGAWTLLFCAWALATIPASPSPAYAAVACITLVCVTLFAPALLAQVDKRLIIKTIFASSLAFIAMAWALYYLVPSIGRSAYEAGGAIEYRVGGDAQQLGFQGLWLIAMSLVMVSARMMHWTISLVPIGIGLVTIASAQSRTSLIAAVAAIGLAILLKAPRQRVLALSMLALGVGSLGVFVLASGMFSVRGADLLTSASRSGSQEEIYNVTGRTEFWPFVLKQISKSPLWGYGFGSARYALYDFNGHSYTMGTLHHAHNIFLNTTLTTGLIGAALLLAMHLSLFDGVLRNRRLFPALVLVAIVITGLTESPILGPMPRTHTVLWLLALYWNQSDSSTANLTSISL